MLPILVVAGKAVDDDGNGQSEGEHAKNSTESTQNPPEASLAKYRKNMFVSHFYVKDTF